MFDVADLTRQCRKAAAEEVAFASDDELLAVAVELQSARSALEVAEAHVLAELRVRGVTEQRFGLKTPQWVAAQAKVDRRALVRRERLGCRLRQLPAVDAAAACGALSADHAAVVAEAAANPRVGEQVAAIESDLVDQARSTSFAEWKHQLGQLVVLLDQDGGFDPDRELARNKLRFTPLPDGSLGVAADLVGEPALVVRQSVEAHADRLFHRFARDHDRCAELPVPTRATLLALALAELVRHGTTIDRDTTTGPAVDVTLVIEATKAPDLEADRGCETNPLTDHCGPAATPDGFGVGPEVAEVLLCDPAITALVVDTLGVPLDLGRQTRLATRDQRRALARRDGGCTFPGCDLPVGWCDAHHVTWWTDGGATDIANLALLCRYHHGITHRHGWTMTPTDDHWFTWSTPSGDQLPSQRHRGRSPTPHPALTPA